MYGFRDFLIEAPADVPQSQTDNPFWDILRTLPGDRIEWQFRHRWSPDWVSTMLTGSQITRDELCNQYAWAIPDPLSLEFLREQCMTMPLIEIGAGTGYWAWQLSQVGVAICAYDSAPPHISPDNHYHCPLNASGYGKHETRPIFFDVQQGGPEVLTAHSDRTLFLCWPPMSDMAVQCLRTYRGARLVYIGEYAGGCTADDAFFVALEKDWQEVATHTPIQWSGIHDVIGVYERKQPRAVRKGRKERK